MITLPDVGLATKANTAILLPTYSCQIDADTHESLLGVTDLFSGYISIKGMPDVTVARNHLFNRAWKSSFDWFVCLDADIAFSRPDFIALTTVESATDYCVSGAYYKKNDQQEEVTHGLGFARIHRSVLDQIATRFPMPYTEDGQSLNVFSYTARTTDGKMLRSDTSFWFLCWQLGITPRILRSDTLLHFGRHAYGRMAHRAMSV